MKKSTPANFKISELSLFKVLSDATGVETLVSQVLQMISYVSASVNGNTVPESASQARNLLNWKPVQILNH